MSIDQFTNRARRRAGRLPVALLVLLPGFAAAGVPVDANWVLDPGVDVRMVTFYQNKDGKSTTLAALGAHFGVNLSSGHSPVEAGLFADYELASREEQSGVRLAGAWMLYRFARWELSTGGAHFESRHATGQWLYASKLKYKPRNGHSLAIEAIGAMRGGDPALQLVYETDLSERVTLTIGAGLGSNSLQDVGASTRFVWNLW